MHKTLKHKWRLRNDIELDSFIFNFTFYLATILRHLPSASLNWGLTTPRVRFVDLTFCLRSIVNHITPLLGVCLYSHLSNISFSLSRAHFRRIISDRIFTIEVSIEHGWIADPTLDRVSCSLPLIAWYEKEYQEYNLSSKISWWEFWIMYFFFYPSVVFLACYTLILLIVIVIRITRMMNPQTSLFYIIFSVVSILEIIGNPMKKNKRHQSFLSIKWAKTPWKLFYQRWVMHQKNQRPNVFYTYRLRVRREHVKVLGNHQRK